MSWSDALIMHLSLLYSWRFSRYSAPIHWLDYSHMTSNKETVSRQMLWAGNIAKTMTSNWKQFTVTCQMLTTVARDRWNLLGERWILFPSNLNVSLNFIAGNIEILGKQNSLFPSGPVIKCLMLIMHLSGRHGVGILVSPQKSQLPPSHQKTWLVKKYKDVINYQKFPSPQGRLCQSNPHINR